LGAEGLMDATTTTTPQQLFDAAVAYAKLYYGFEVGVVYDSTPEQREVAGEVDLQEQKIRIVNFRSKDKMLYVLLHEIGHLIRNRKEHASSVNSNAVVLQNSFSHASLTHKLAVLQEEFEAWDEGLALAKRKGWVIDEKAYNRQRTKCLKSYVVWCTDT
jgi:hypothetical protein